MHQAKPILCSLHKHWWALFVRRPGWRWLFPVWRWDLCESMFYFLSEDVSVWASSSSEEVLSILRRVSGGERPPETSWPWAHGEQWCRGPQEVQLGHIQRSPCPSARGTMEVGGCRHTGAETWEKLIYCARKRVSAGQGYGTKESYQRRGCSGSCVWWHSDHGGVDEKDFLLLFHIAPF